MGLVPIVFNTVLSKSHYEKPCEDPNIWLFSFPNLSVVPTCVKHIQIEVVKTVLNTLLMAGVLEFLPEDASDQPTCH